jgi:hypothetical protein
MTKNYPNNPSAIARLRAHRREVFANYAKNGSSADFMPGPDIDSEIVEGTIDGVKARIRNVRGLFLGVAIGVSLWVIVAIAIGMAFLPWLP